MDFGAQQADLLPLSAVGRSKEANNLRPNARVIDAVVGPSFLSRPEIEAHVTHSLFSGLSRVKSQRRPDVGDKSCCRSARRSPDAWRELADEERTCRSAFIASLFGKDGFMMYYNLCK